MKKATIRYCCNALIMGVAVFACGIFAETSVKAEGTPETVPPIESAAPQVTPEVSAVPTVVTPAPTAPPVTLAPVPHVKPLKKVTKVKAVRYSTTAVKVSWKQTKQAEYYHVYYKLEKNSGKWYLPEIPSARALLMRADFRRCIWTQRKK